MATTMKLIAKQTLGSSAASVAFSSIPGTYTDLLLTFSARTTNSTVPDGYIGFNSSTANFSARYLYGTGSGTGSASGVARYLGAQVPTAYTASTFGATEIYIPNYAGSTNKSYSITNTTENNATGSYLEAIAGLWSNTSAITSIELTLSAGSWAASSSFFLYGITKS